MPINVLVNATVEILLLIQYLHLITITIIEYPAESRTSERATIVLRPTQRYTILYICPLE